MFLFYINYEILLNHKRILTLCQTCLNCNSSFLASHMKGMSSTIRFPPNWEKIFTDISPVWAVIETTWFSLSTCGRPEDSFLTRKISYSSLLRHLMRLASQSLFGSCRNSVSEKYVTYKIKRGMQFSLVWILGLQYYLYRWR